MAGGGSGVAEIKSLDWSSDSSMDRVFGPVDGGFYFF